MGHIFKFILALGVLFTSIHGNAAAGAGDGRARGDSPGEIRVRTVEYLLEIKMFGGGDVLTINLGGDAPTSKQVEDRARAGIKSSGGLGTKALELKGLDSDKYLLVDHTKLKDRTVDPSLILDDRKLNEYIEKRLNEEAGTKASKIIIKIYLYYGREA